MKWTIDPKRIPDFVRIETSGKPTLKHYLSMWGEILTSDFWKPGLTVLLDNRKLKPLENPDEFTVGAADYFADNKSRMGKACIAALISEPDKFKYARQLQYAIRLRGSDVALQIFSTETQAVQWLEHYCKLRDKEENGITA